MRVRCAVPDAVLGGQNDNAVLATANSVAERTFICLSGCCARFAFVNWWHELAVCGRMTGLSSSLISSLSGAFKAIHMLLCWTVRGLGRWMGGRLWAL